MVRNDHIHTARVDVVNGFVGRNSRIASNDETRAIIKYRLKSLDVNAMTLLAANRDVINDIRTECLERLHEQCCGGLTVHVEVAPDADGLMVTNRLTDAIHGRFDVWERRGWQR